MADVQEYQQFASDFTGSIATLQQDTCADFTSEKTPTVAECPTCTTNPNAIVPDWTTNKEPFLNQQTCQYYVSVVTKYTDVGGDDYVKRVKEYAPVAARRLLRFYNKLETDEVVDLLVNGYAGSGAVLQAKDWFLPLHTNSRLRILYKIDAYNFDGLASDTEDPDAFGKEPTPSSNELILDLSTFSTKIDRITRVFSVYSRLQAALRNIDNGSIMFENTPKKEFILGDIDKPNSILNELSNLDATISGVLSDNNFAEIGFFSAFSSIFSSIRNANYFKIGFTDEYTLSRITIIETGCPDVVIEGKKLERYSDDSPFNNPTIIAYLSRLDELYDTVIAADAPQWTDVIVEYTYPNVTINYGENTLFDDEESLAECIASAISDYGTSVTNRALDSLYKYPDLVADRMNKYLCTDYDIDEELTAADIIAKEKGKFFEKLEKSWTDSELFETVSQINQFSLRIKSLKAESGGKVSIAKIFEDIIDDFGWCGFLALFQSLFQCISFDFSFEEMLKKLVNAGLKQLNPLQMSKLLSLLPVDKQTEVVLKVDQVLQENDIVSQFFGSFDTTGGLTGIATNEEFQKEKEQEEAIEIATAAAITQAKSSLIATENITKLINEEKRAIAEQQRLEKDTSSETKLASLQETETQFETMAIESNFSEWNATNVLQAARINSANSRGQLGANSFGNTIGQVQVIVMQAYIEALLELVDINELYNALMKFPGVKILTQFVDAANCPSPDENSKITWLNFLHTLEVDWCRFHFDITLPPLPTIPDLSAFFATLWRSLGQVAKELFLKLITQIFFEILLKLFEMLINSLCHLLDTVAQSASAALTSGNTETAMLDMFRETFGCPPLNNSEQEEALLDAVAQIFGGQSGTAVTTAEVASFMQNTSYALTSYELVDLLKGKLSSDKATYLKDFLRLTDPKLVSLFPTESALSSVFSTLGNLIPDDILQDYEDKATATIDSEFPAIASICGTPDTIDKFRKLREDILASKGLSDEEIKHQIDVMHDTADKNLDFIIDLAAKGINNYAGEKTTIALLGASSLINPASAFSKPECETSLYGSAYSSATVKAAASTTNDIFFNSLIVSYVNDLFKEPGFFESFGPAPVAFLNGVLSDKSGRDFVKHNKRTNDLFGRVYNNTEQQEEYELAPILSISKPEDSYFPETVSKLTQDSLKQASELSDNIFSVQNTGYNINNPKRMIFGKKEDFSYAVDTANAESIKQPYFYTMLYSQCVLNSDNSVSSNNLSRIAIMKDTNSNLFELTYRIIPDLPPDLATGLDISLALENRFSTESYLTMYQSKFDLDDGIKNLKEQYTPASLTYSPQTDSFLSYVQQKFDLGEYSSLSTASVDIFNNIADKCMKWVISTLTNDEAYKYGYDYKKEKITIEDIELDPETLERKTNNPRVQFLDYTKYGGTEDQPPVYIKPATRTGWLGVTDSIIPELSCKPETEKLVNFEQLKSLLSDLQSSLSDDPALQYPPDCREVVPYLKPLSSEMAAKLQVVIIATMRIYIGEAILKCVPLFNKFVVSYDKVIDELYLDYIIKRLEDGLLNQQTGLFSTGAINDEYYLRFLEQCVQIVGRKKLNSEIELSDTEQAAMDSINNMIRDFFFVKERDATFLEQLNSVLGDLKEPAATLISYIKTKSVFDTQKKYDAFIAVLETKVSEYPELSEYNITIPSLYNIYSASADENGVASSPTTNDILKELNNLLSTISSIQIAAATEMDDMLKTVMSRLNEKSNLGIFSVKDIRREMVYEGIRRTRYEAKILMRKIFKDEFDSMASNFAANIYTSPTITNLRKYFLDSDDKIILRNVSSSYFDVAADVSAGDNPLSTLSSTITVGTGSVSVSGSVDYINNTNGYFILERYIKLEDRISPLSGTVIPDDIANRPESINGIINVHTFKDWISTLSTETQNTEMFKLFGDLSVSGSQEEGFGLTGSTLGVKYGLRLSFIPPDNYTFGNSNAAINEKKAYLLDSAYTIDGKELKNSSYIIPVVEVEIDMIDDLLGNFDPNNGVNIYNHDCLIKELYDNDEFRFLFYYCFPLQKYMSANCVFVSETYLRVLGLSDGWVVPPIVSYDDKKEDSLKFTNSKLAATRLFDIYYNWEDYDSYNATIKSLTSNTDPLLQTISSWLRPVAGGPWWPFLQLLSPKIVKRRPYDEEGNDCDVIDR
jgi:hypothetical protein